MRLVSKSRKWRREGVIAAAYDQDMNGTVTERREIAGGGVSVFCGTDRRHRPVYLLLDTSEALGLRMRLTEIETGPCPVEVQSKVLLEAASRFLSLYQSSEHDGESWGLKGAVERRAEALAVAVAGMEKLVKHVKPATAAGGGA